MRPLRVWRNLSSIALDHALLTLESQPKGVEIQIDSGDLDIAGQMFSMQFANDQLTLRDEPEETVSGKLMALATALGGSTELLPGFIELQADAQGVLEMPCDVIL
jgi:hypothetical protein